MERWERDDDKERTDNRRIRSFFHLPNNSLSSRRTPFADLIWRIYTTSTILSRKTTTTSSCCKVSSWSKPFPVGAGLKEKEREGVNIFFFSLPPSLLFCSLASRSSPIFPSSSSSYLSLVFPLSSSLTYPI